MLLNHGAYLPSELLLEVAQLLRLIGGGRRNGNAKQRQQKEAMDFGIQWHTDRVRHLEGICAKVSIAIRFYGRLRRCGGEMLPAIEAVYRQ
jgi:hypothetical protein